MGKKIGNLILLALIISITNETFGQINLYGNLKPGPYQVGFKQAEINIIPKKDEGRAIHISFWYPAEKSNARRLTFVDYLSTDDQTMTGLANILSVKIAGEEQLFPQDSMELLLGAKVLASSDAPEVKEKFPVIMWSGRNETVQYQWLISEYLASNGYIVAYAEDVPTGPFPWQIPSAEEKETELDQQISNMSGALMHLQLQNNVDLTKSGIISWSYAGESAILGQIRNPEFKAVVGLSSLGFSSGVFLGSELESKVDTKKLNVPYLMLFEKVAPNGNERTIPEIFSSLHPDSRYVSFPELAHGSFNTLEGMIPGVLGTDKVHSWSRGGDVAKTGFSVICKLTLAFLNATLKNKGSFDAAVADVKKDVTEEFVISRTPQD